MNGFAASAVAGLMLGSAWAYAADSLSGAIAHSPAARSELAPTGKLRVGLPVTNPVAVTRDGLDEEMQGIAVDLARAFARRLGVPLEPVRYKTATALLKGAKAGEWDVAFLRYNAERMTDMDVAGVHLELGETYLVPEGSRIQNVSDADSSSYQIVTIPGSLADQFLSQHLRQAKVIHARSYSAGIDLMSEGKADALAGDHATLSGWAAKRPTFRVAKDSFMRIENAFVVMNGRPAGLAEAKAFIEYAKTSGLVQQAIDRSGLAGVTVAPPAPIK